MNWLDLNVLPWLIPVPPLVAFMVIILVAKRSRLLTQIFAIGGITLSWVMGWYVVYQVYTTAKDLGLGNKVFGTPIDWLANGVGYSKASGGLQIGVFLDPLNTVMLFMVPLACLMIFIYTLGYMSKDPRYERFFAFLSLFAGAMLTLVVADNLLLLFIGWEVMGLCSYLLIGFWYEKPSAYKAAIKAFITTRIGDVIMMLGIAYLWSATGTLSFRAIMNDAKVLEDLVKMPALGGILGISAASLIGICLVAGTIGKSAQFPLHVWLPDAMEGPTPVSAMIHAAAMVSAGIYLIIRMFPILSAGAHVEEGLLTPPMVLMGVVGAFTALFAATIALAQNDVKKVLAYSTISQLGFMMAALGIGAYVAAAFHLITHAFFKALLFMGSGAVIHAMEHGHHHVHAHAGGHGGGLAGGYDPRDAHDAHGSHGGHDEHASHADHADHDDHAAHDEHAFDPQDMRNMGGLGQRIPVTMWTFIIGGSALAGFPLITAGFWSKDEILADAFNMSSKSPVAIFVLVCLSLAAILTALYTFRQIAMTFWGKPRTEAAEHAILNDGTPSGFNISWQMQLPLVILSFFALVAGFAGVNKDFPVIGPMIKSIFGLETPFANFVSRTLLEAPHHLAFNWWPVLISFTVFGLGVWAGYSLYGRREYSLQEADPMERILGADIYRILKNKYYFDEFYVAAFVKPLQWFADVFTNRILDQGIIDGILHTVAKSAVWVGNLTREFNRVVIDGVGDGLPASLIDAARSLRRLQTGHIQQYLLYALVASLWVGGNLVLLAAFPQIVGWAALTQAVVAVGLILLLNLRSSRTSS